MNETFTFHVFESRGHANGTGGCVDQGCERGFGSVRNHLNDNVDPARSAFIDAILARLRKSERNEERIAA